MVQRMVAIVVAVPLLLTLVVVAAVSPLPYGTYSPGPTIDLLAQPGGTETIYVRGHKTYRDTGQLRMTTVSVSPTGDGLSLAELLYAWFDGEDAVYPYDFVHPDDETAQQDQQQGLVDMRTSQAAAAAVALRALGYDVPEAIQVALVEPGRPADGVLEPGDVLVAVDGEKVGVDTDVITRAITDSGGDPVTFTVEREGRRLSKQVTPADSEGRLRVGIQLGVGYRDPFDVGVNIDPAIGGPSAGLMFSLAMYDTLTPGSLTRGRVVAGTGTIDGSGAVGPIGGIQQKIYGAQADGAQLFLVPADNCPDAERLDVDIRLTRVGTFDEALAAVQAFSDDPSADLPTCEDS